MKDSSNVDIPFVVRTIQKRSIREVALLRTLFDERGFFSGVDWRFWELLFRRLARCPSVIFLEAFDRSKQRVAGYIVASVEFSRTKQLLISGGFVVKAAWYIFLMLIRTPSKLRNVMCGLFRADQSNLIPEQRWITWVVHPEYRKQGVGTLLYAGLCQRMREADVKLFYGPVECQNTASNQAHARFNARNLGVINIENTPHYLWEHDVRQNIIAFTTKIIKT